LYFKGEFFTEVLRDSWQWNSMAFLPHQIDQSMGFWWGYNGWDVGVWEKKEKPMQENKMPMSIGVGWPCFEGVEYFKISKICRPWLNEWWWCMVRYSSFLKEVRLLFFWDSLTS
jgi:hypothetical protein